jgi:hypothetical protein
MAVTIDDAFVSVWQQMLIDGKPEVVLGRRRFPVRWIRSKQLRAADIVVGQRTFSAIEQNPGTSSRWAALAREGKRILQIKHDNRFVANVCEGRILHYPAWRAAKLPSASADTPA